MIPRRVIPGGSRALVRLLRSAPGQAVTDLEQAVAELVGQPHAVAVGSGRRAMTLILGQLGLGDGDEVIVPAWTLGALVPLVQGLGARVVPVDVEPRGWGVDPAALEVRLGPRTRAVLVLHPFGTPCAIGALAALCLDRGVALVEDCAHSLGASVGGRPTGSFGWAGFFSFEVTKPLNTWGGGMLVTADAALAAAAREAAAGGRADASVPAKKLLSARVEEILLRSGLGLPALALLASPRWRGRIERLYRRVQVVPAADLAYLPQQAAMGLAGLAALAARQEEREGTVRHLRALLRPDVVMQAVSPGDRSSWTMLVVRLPVPAEPVRRGLLRRGLDAAVGSEIADDVAAALGDPGCPVVAELTRHALALPLWDGMDTPVLVRMAQAVNDEVARARG